MRSSNRREIHLYNLSLIPAGVILMIFLTLFAYSLHNNYIRTVWDFLWFALPFWLAMIEVIFFSFEVLWKKEANGRFNLKRFGGRTILTVLGFGSFVALLTIIIKIQFWKDEGTNVFISSAVWFSVWLIIVAVFKQTVKKLAEGQW